jgi:hypothetical protein
MFHRSTNSKDNTMNRLLALLTVGMIAGAAVADIPPPPPPKGKKYVSVSNEVVLGKDVSGYVFVQSRQGFIGPGMLVSNYEKLEPSATKPTAIAAGGRRISVRLFAVPQDAAKQFKTDAELFEALKANKVTGAHSIAFDDTATVSDKVKGDSVKWTCTITAIDKDGIKKTVEGEGYEQPKDKPKKDGGKNDSPEDEDAPAATAPRGGTWIAGVAAFAALTLGGLWVAGRGRRRV